jgi:uncharacterized membrane protein YccC
VDFSEFVDRIVSFAQNNTVIAIILALVLLFFMYRKPKLFLGLLLLTVFLAGLYYMIMSVAGSGSGQKKRLMDQEESQSNSNR